MWQYNQFFTDDLYHHGILGQRWGRRNGPPYPLSYQDHSSAEKKHLSRSDYWEQKKAQIINTSRKPASSMTTDELRKEVDRLMLEKRYNELMSELYRNDNTSNKKVENAKRFIGDLVKKPVMDVGRGVIKYLLKDAVNKIASKKGSGPIFVNENKK